MGVVAELAKGDTDTGILAAWVQEAARRDVEIDRGEVQMIPAEQVFAELYGELN
jgi:hypothetical protein